MMRIFGKKWVFIILIIFSAPIFILAADGKVTKQNSGWLFGKKTSLTGVADRKSGIMDGNLVMTLFYNFGGIGNWSIAGRLNSGIYPKGSGRSYFAEFTPIIGAECFNVEGMPIHIFSDGIVVDSRNQMDKDENGRQLGWDPVPGYANPLQDKIAMSDDPESWPPSWPDKDDSWNGFWNGQYGKYVRGDLETYFVMNDFGNDEFPYYPINHSIYSHLTGDLKTIDQDNRLMALIDTDTRFDPDEIRLYGNKDVLKVYNGVREEDADWYEIVRPGNVDNSGLTDTLYVKASYSTSNFNDQAGIEYSIMKGSKRGLGFTVEVRGYQWAHPAAEDLIIWTYWIKNTSDYEYKDVVFAMYGDADVGDNGDQGDDDAWFDRPNAIVYQWDHDMWSNAKGGFKPAYFGWRFLESPGDPLDGKDNDFDGLVDESQFDGIDNDGDWDPDVDDIGADGIGPNDEDYMGPDADGTEGNGIPDPGEPNFEYTDNSESDQIGLTSFVAKAWPGILCSYDEGVWQQTLPEFFTDIQNTVDLTFLYGSGYFKLPVDVKRKFSVAMVLGEDQQDIFRNANVIQQIYDADYAFAKPPKKPRVWVVAGDRKVTLYWDRRAENSIDHIYGKDFEGYRIYKATDPNFLESKLVTDAYGNVTFNKPIAQFDLDDGLTGLHPVDYNGVKYYMGDDTGLQYSFVDTNVENGQTYYYAVCSYDKGYYQGFYQRGLAEEDSLPPMQPSECSKRIFTDVQGNVLATDDNTVMVVPNAPVAGYTPPSIAYIDSSQFTGTGNVEIEFVDPLLVEDNRIYEIHFSDTGTDSLDNDGDWVPWKDQADGIYNEGERFLDYGLDATPDSLEEGFNPNFNPDPAHDNYNKFTNPIDRFDNDMDGAIDSSDTTSDGSLDDWGTENNFRIDWFDANGDGLYQKEEEGETFFDAGNGVRDPGEALVHDLGADGIDGTGDQGEGDGIPTVGEPNIDIRDNEERVRNTTAFSLIDVTDPDNPDTLIKDSPWVHGEVFNDFVHGMHIMVNTSAISVMKDASRWSNPKNIFSHSSKLYTEGIGGVGIAHDYQIIVTDSVQFESYNHIMANFYVMDLSTGDTADFVYMARTRTGQLSMGDKIIPLIENYDINSSSPIKGTWQIEMTSKLPDVVQIFKDSQGRLWCLADDRDYGGIGYYADSLWVKAVEDLEPKAMIEYADGSLWVGTPDGLYTFDGASLQPAPVDTFAEANTAINALLTDNDNTVWIGTGSGLTHYINSEVTEFFKETDSLFTSYIILCIYQTSDDSVWAGTTNGIIIAGNGFARELPGSELPGGNVNVIYENNLGVFVGTNNGVGFRPAGSQEFLTVASALPNKKVYCFADFQDSLWIGTEKGLASVAHSDLSGFASGGTEPPVSSYSTSSGQLRSDKIYSLLNVDGRLWIGNHQGFDYRESGKWGTFAPLPGDVFTLKISKPFNSDDVFQFETKAAYVDAAAAKKDLNKIAVVPNPYIVAASWEPMHLYTSGRGIQKLDFIHLPKECTIKIYTIRGYLVRTLQHSSTLDNGAESWDLKTKDGLDCAYGVYIYHVDAPGIGTYIGKFAVIK